MPSQRDSLDRLWKRCAGLPGGTWLFSRAFGLAVPYSATIGSRVVALEPGYCKTLLRDRRGPRNHLALIHAVALVNLGEMTSGLAMTMALTADVRGIVTTIGADYLKKARGTLTAEARVTVPPLGPEPQNTRVETIISDAAGDVVCRVFTIWRLARS